MSAAQDEFNELMRNKERRTRHPSDDNDDAESFLNLSEDDNDRAYSNPPSPGASIATARASTSIPTRRYAANTGPKGVISDAQNFRDSRRSERTSMASARTSMTSMRTAQRSSSRSVHEGRLDEEDEEDDLDDEEGPADQGFMARWRQSRIREMQNGGKGSSMHLNGKNSNRNAFGGMATVDGEGYLDAVDNSGPDTVVVVYIYDEYVSLLVGRICCEYQ
jgi:hypothetical protein